MVETRTQIANTEPGVYDSGKYSKVGDFFIGLGIYVGFCFIFSLIGQLLSILIRGLAFNNIESIIVLSPFLGLTLLSWVIPLIASLIIAKKYFPNRKLVRVGIWFLFLLPIILLLLALGACMINPPTW